MAHISSQNDETMHMGCRGNCYILETGLIGACSVNYLSGYVGASQIKRQ